jgi:hypothetical protein
MHLIAVPYFYAASLRSCHESTSSQTDTTSPVSMPTAAALKKDDSKEKATYWMNFF